MPSIFGIWTDSLDHFVHLLVAYLPALPIGWHRARGTRRRFAHVSLGCDRQLRSGADGDIVFGAMAVVNANILQGVVTGIGFIGAGAIIRQGDLTTGHATAASIWTVGIMGVAVGCGYYDIGIILAVANLAVLALRRRSAAG
jgi:putative Mg2+ transporter-C (MgtC) family protein